MKLVKEPIFNVISCKCGTVFQPETGDYLSYKFKNDNSFEIESIWTRCPTCGSSQEVTTRQSCNACARNDCEKAQHVENYRFKECKDFKPEDKR